MSAFVDTIHGVDCFECGFEYRTLSLEEAEIVAASHNRSCHPGETGHKA